MAVIHDAPPAPAQRRRLAPPLLFAVAVATSAWVWWTVAYPVLVGEIGPHADHALPLLAHVVGGTLMLAAGSAALFIGWTRVGFRLHKPVAYTYLISGAVAAISALGLNLFAPHGDFGIAAATSTLSAVWLSTAFMAWRAIRNGRVQSHRRWVIRSYVLTWTFVFCRIVQQSEAVAALGEGAVGHVIWMTWIGPLVICELVLQWRDTARAEVGAA